MAHFYATASGSAKTEATRCGTKNSGLYATANGWDIGGEIELKYDSNLDTDIVKLYTTTGSNGNRRKLVMSYAIIEGKMRILQTEYPELLI